MICPIHQVELKTIPAGVSKKTGRPYNAFEACPIQDCTYKPPRENTYSSPRRAYTPPAKPDRNWDREAYEKCASIWAAAYLQDGQTKVADLVRFIDGGGYWELFQAIRADGEKRFATGMEKARQAFGPPNIIGPSVDEAPFPDQEPPIPTW